MNKTAETRHKLEAIRAELNERLDRIRSDRTRKDAALSPDFAEQAVQRENDEVLERLEASTESELCQVSHALDRLARGHFGVCEVCHYPIEPERLAAVPQATACSSCAAQPQARAA